MKKILLASLMLLGLASCDDFLTKDPLTSFQDDDFWCNENNVRGFAMGYYASRFPGYGSLCALRGQKARSQGPFEGRNAQVELPASENLPACAAGSTRLARLLGRQDHAVLCRRIHPCRRHCGLFEQGRATHL